MKKKILALVICIVVFFAAALPVDAEPDLTLDFNKRYTDISEYEDVNDPYLDLGKNSEATEQKRNIYAVVLCICLVVAIAVFIYTLRKVPDESSFEAKEKRKLRGYKDESTESSVSVEKFETLKDEEKTL